MNKLVVVTDTNIIPDLRANNHRLLYPLKSFCVGYNLEFDIDDIDDFVLVNRILDEREINRLASVIKSSHVRGIVFDDLGIIDVIKDLEIEKILLLDHLGTNYESINYYLDYVDSVVVSNDLTKDEILNILDKSSKPLCLEVFGLKRLMYSRRTLLTNYEKYHNIASDKEIITKIDDNYFKVIENDYGTVFYAYPYYNGLELLNSNNVLYYIYNPIMLSEDEIIDIVINNNIGNIPNNKLFLDKKTYYKVGE